MKDDRGIERAPAGPPKQAVARRKQNLPADQQTVLYRKLKRAYERLDVLVNNQQYDELADMVAGTSAILDDLRVLASAAEGDESRAAKVSGTDSELQTFPSERTRSVTEVLETCESMLERLMAAAEETRAVLDYLARARRGIDQYRSLRSTAPRVRSCWA